MKMIWASDPHGGPRVTCNGFLPLHSMLMLEIPRVEVDLLTDSSSASHGGLPLYYSGTGSVVAGPCSGRCDFH